MAREFHFTRRVEFAETDLAGIAHFTNFFRWMEEAEHAFLRSLGFSVHEIRDGVTVGWPRIAASCKYFKPARFEDVLDVRLRVRRRGRKALAFSFSFCKAGEELARGEVTTMCCRCGPGGKLQSIPIPEEIWAKMKARADE